MEDYHPRTYGEAFADVYDEWYSDVTDTAACVAAVARLAGGGPVLEMGAGTGRLALPLAAAGRGHLGPGRLPGDAGRPGRQARRRAGAAGARRHGPPAVAARRRLRGGAVRLQLAVQPARRGGAAALPAGGGHPAGSRRSPDRGDLAARRRPRTRRGRGDRQRSRGVPGRQRGRASHRVRPGGAQRLAARPGEPGHPRSDDRHRRRRDPAAAVAAALPHRGPARRRRPGRRAGVAGALGGLGWRDVRPDPVEPSRSPSTAGADEAARRDLHRGGARGGVGRTSRTSTPTPSGWPTPWPSSS